MTKIRKTFDELLAEQRKSRKHPAEEEHRIQCACVKWFRLCYPRLSYALFAVPNGGRRDKTTAAKLKAEGVLSGVADLILLCSNDRYGALLIEMKTRKGRQAETQRAWQHAVELDAYKYVVCRSLDDFIREVENYLHNITIPEGSPEGK